tara:strand:+ start:1418 stop:1648 length:231 start_codon:yes stop_codon:yes gene_type:complete
MSDYPWRVGDLVRVRTLSGDPIAVNDLRQVILEGLLVSGPELGFWDVLIDGEIRHIHNRYFIAPQIKKVNFSGGRK